MNLSIVIPIYNSDKHLKKCLESLKNQIYTDFEVIMINDGSTDKSKEIALDFVNYDDRFKYFEIKNSGVSYARNYGIEKTSGKYLTFVDSDDFLDNDHFQLFMNEIKNNDLVVGGYKVVGPEPEIRTHSKPVILNRYTLIQGILKDLSIFSFPWNKIFRSDIIKECNIRFRTDIHFGEDLIFDIEYALRVETAYVLTTDSYNYVQHNNSISARLDKKKLIKRMTDIDAMIYTISLLENDYPVEANFLRERVAQEGLRYWHLSKKFQLSRTLVDEYKLKIQPYLRWFFLKRKKDSKTLKLLLKYLAYITAARLRR